MRSIFVGFPIFTLPFLTPLVSYIMSIHIAAKQGEIADKILLPGDPLRANSLLRISLKMLYVSMRFVTCLVTQEHTKVNVSQ